MLRFKVIWAIFVRNFLSYFSGVLGYLFIVVFVIVGALLTFQPRFFVENLATLDQLNEWFPYLLLFMVPAITMSAWADEKKLGTDELLFTLPASDLSILLGKYLAVVAVYTMTLLFTFPYLIELARQGTPDWGLIFSNYLGYWLAGCALLAAGLFASSLTNSTTVAFVLGTVICAIPIFLGEFNKGFDFLMHYSWIENLFAEGSWLSTTLQKFTPGEDFLLKLSLIEHFKDFRMGVMTLPALAYFVSLIVLFLYLNLIVITKRHWSSRQGLGMGTQYLLRALSLLVVLITLNHFAHDNGLRWDLTSAKMNSLQPVTSEVLEQIEEDRPILIQAFVSKEVPKRFVSLKQQLLRLLREYDNRAGENIEVRVVDVEPFSKEAQEARQFDIHQETVQDEQDGRNITQGIYLGAVLTSSYDEVVIPYFGPGTPIEHELTASINVVSRKKRLKIGILQTDAKVIDTRREWMIIEKLRQFYDVESIAPESLPLDDKNSGAKKEKDSKDKDEESTDNKKNNKNNNEEDNKTEKDNNKIDILIAILPSSLTEPQMDQLVTYIQQGNPTLIFDDPMPFFPFQTRLPTLSGVATVVRNVPRLPKQAPPQPRNRFAPPPRAEKKADDGKALALVNALGIQWEYDQIVTDSFNPYPQYEDIILPEFIFASNDNGLKEAIDNANIKALKEKEKRIAKQKDQEDDEQNHLTILEAGILSAHKKGISASINTESPITAGLDEVMLMFSGSISKLPDPEKSEKNNGPKLKFTPLLTTGFQSGLLDWYDFTADFRHLPEQIQEFYKQQGAILKDPRPSKRDIAAHILAAHIQAVPAAEDSSKPDETTSEESHPSKTSSNSAEKRGINVVYVADIDLITDWIFYERDRKHFDISVDNVDFLFNAIDVLTGQEKIVKLRSKQTESRSLVHFEKLTSDIRDEQLKKLKEEDDRAKEVIDKVKKQYDEKIKQIKEDESLEKKEREIREARETSIKKRVLLVKETDAENRKAEEKEKINSDTKRQIREREREIQLRAAIFSPLPAMILGLFVLTVHLFNERRHVTKERLVSRQKSKS